MHLILKPKCRMVRDRRSSLKETPFAAGKSSKSLSAWRAAGLLASMLCLTGMTIAPQGPRAGGLPRTQHEKVDLGFIKIGTTTRDEVFRQLAWADAGIQNDRMFLARWGSSHLFLIVAIYGAGAGAGTIWSARNLLVEFDAKGVIENVRPARDADLFRELSAWLVKAKEPPFDFSELMATIVTEGRRHGSLRTLNLGRDFFGVDDVRISPQEITGIDTLPDPDPAYFSLRIHFAKGSAVGKALSIHMRTTDLLTLVNYLQQNHVQMVATK